MGSDHDVDGEFFSGDNPRGKALYLISVLSRITSKFPRGLNFVVPSFFRSPETCFFGDCLLLYMLSSLLPHSVIEFIYKVEKDVFRLIQEVIELERALNYRYTNN